MQESAKVIDRRDRNDLAWREKRHVEAIERKLVNDERDAIDIWEDILLKFPTGKKIISVYSAAIPAAPTLLG